MRCRPLYLPILLAAWAGSAASAAAQTTTVDAGGYAAYVWVPELTGALTLGLGFEGRLDGAAFADDSPLLEDALRLDVGYLRYLEGHGRIATGGYGALVVGIPDGEGERFGRIDLGGLVRLRGASNDFDTGTVALFGEVGWLPGQSGLRFAGGIEMGPGRLWYSDPYLFGEILGRLGVSRIRYSDRDDTLIFAGIRLVIDVTQRRGLAR